jgi:hypothetical protein
MEDLLPDFLVETLESLEKLDIELVTLERQPDDKPALSSIFRHVAFLGCRGWKKWRTQPRAYWIAIAAVACRSHRLRSR